MRYRRPIAALVVALSAAVALGPVMALANQSGDGPYQDPADMCRNHSNVDHATVVTADPTVPTNPERDTFYGFHNNPGYDNWYGHFYGDFRGSAADDSGWKFIMRVNYPDTGHWNFSDWNWAVHGHATQYIAYYNWTFGGECGMGSYGGADPPPYMADITGPAVVDIYVDSVPPENPRPYATSVTSDAVTLTWDAVRDIGDGLGQDIYTSGLQKYEYWLTVNGADGGHTTSSQPQSVTASNLSPGDVVCLNVVAVDNLQNATAPQSGCARPDTPPSPPVTPSAGSVAANPSPAGLTGLPSWLWLTPTPAAQTTQEKSGADTYEITMTPISASWDYGDGAHFVATGQGAFGDPYPATSSIQHLYETQSQAGYVISARVTWQETWTVTNGGHTRGPFTGPATTSDAVPLTYPVQQAQPELVSP